MVEDTDKISDDNNKYYFPVPGKKLCDLLDWDDPHQRNQRHLAHACQKHEIKKSRLDPDLEDHGIDKKCFGDLILLNDERIALFRRGTTVYAFEAKCPHAGGPLNLADIEEVFPGQFGLRCPWHNWTFDLDTGKCLLPPGRELMARTFPVQVRENGWIYVGFDSFGRSAFIIDAW